MTKPFKTAEDRHRAVHRRLAQRACSLPMLASYMRVKKALVQRSLEVLEMRGMVASSKEGGTTIWRVTNSAGEPVLDDERESAATTSLGRRKLTERDDFDDDVPGGFL